MAATAACRSLAFKTMFSCFVTGFCGQVSSQRRVNCCKRKPLQLRRPRSKPCPAFVFASFGGGGPRNGRNNGESEFQGRVVDTFLRTGRFLQTTNGEILLWGGLFWLVITGKIGFVFDSFLFLFILLSVTPIVGVLLFRWWIARQVVAGTCPNCGSAVTGLRDQPFQCINCGQVVKGDKKGDFAWGSEPSSATIDIDAKSVDNFDSS